MGCHCFKLSAIVGMGAKAAVQGQHLPFSHRSQFADHGDQLAVVVQFQDRKSALFIFIDHRFHSAGQFHQIFLLHTSPFSFHHLYL